MSRHSPPPTGGSSPAPASAVHHRPETGARVHISYGIFGDYEATGTVLGPAKEPGMVLVHWDEPWDDITQARISRLEVLP